MSGAELQDGVISVDLLDRATEAVSKFIPYYYYPEATYTVVVSRSSYRTKISVGTNPWTKVPVGKLVNLAEICERFGGGGHARVGAISFGADEVARAPAWPRDCEGVARAVIRSTGHRGESLMTWDHGTR